jgi:hypothetical protein
MPDGGGDLSPASFLDNLSPFEKDGAVAKSFDMCGIVAEKRKKRIIL